jgi:DNA-directed RNA polymerase II subunit RPB1
MTPEMCYSILKNISDKDCLIMGFDPKKARPEDMIIKIFPVPPVQIRPAVKLDTIASETDDLTHKIADIIKTNERIKQNKSSGNENKFKNDVSYLLQYHIATYYDNETLSLPKSEQRNGKPIRSLRARLQGKEGRVRGNMMGKRVDLSARTVITSDPNIDINQVGVPMKMAMTLTYPEIVTLDNIEYLSQLVRNGPTKYPGANYVIETKVLEPGCEIRRITDLKYNKEIKIKPGFIVERHLITGDYVLFNRQPSLHKLSMMAHSAHIIKMPTLSTLRMSVSVTKPYNADFDGDKIFCRSHIKNVASP